MGLKIGIALGLGIVLLLLAQGLSLLFGPKARAAERSRIRVRLCREIRALRFEGPELWIDGLRRYLQPATGGLAILVEEAKKEGAPPGLRIENGGQEYRLPLASLHLQWKGPARIRLGKEKTWRRLFGSLQLLRRGGGWVPNLRIDMELYLSGVLHEEMGAHFPLEALRAQAIAARSYALSCIARSGSRSFDLYGDDRSQVFHEVSEEPRILEAIRLSLGQTLTYGGSTLRAYYHSTCGGRTRDGYLRFRDVPRDALPPVVCDFCKASPLYRWTRKIPKKALQGAGIAVRGETPGFEVLQRSPRGDWERLRIKGGGRTSAPFSARLLRKLGSLPSLWIQSQTYRKGVFVLRGRGFGHGVGLCQWGARGQALLGRSAKEILSFYFPRAKLRIP
ncbi:MAG TPA: SpoIID/LytB domain-containing protein [Planctomycetes bacterium]|nr:SpoIID/LytB domain-containing protein [Planctomycetota bacterium]